MDGGNRGDDMRDERERTYEPGGSPLPASLSPPPKALLVRSFPHGFPYSRLIKAATTGGRRVYHLHNGERKGGSEQCNGNNDKELLHRPVLSSLHSTSRKSRSSALIKQFPAWSKA